MTQFPRIHIVTSEHVVKCTFMHQCKFLIYGKICKQLNYMLAQSCLKREWKIQFPLLASIIWVKKKIQKEGKCSP